MGWMDIDISVDLISAAKRHLHFLDNVDNVEKLLTDNNLLELSVRRYEQLWLPLANEHRSEMIVPPVDIAWIWYCHMLNPLAYRRDCRLILQRTLNHTYVKTKDIIQCTNDTIELWYKKYPKDGFNIIRNDEFVVPSRKTGTITDAASKLSVNLTDTAKSQIHFCYQVALPHFRDKQFLGTALKRYKQFLFLKGLHQDEFLTPPVDIMLMWFTHMCHPKEYAQDTMKTCGRVLENNIRVQIGYITNKYRSASEKTIKHWTDEVKEDLIKSGTKLRARDTKGEINEMKIDELMTCCINLYKLSISRAELVGFPPKFRRRFTIRLQLEQTDSTPDEIIILKGSKRQKLWTFRKIVSYTTNSHCGIRVAFIENNRLLCLKSENTIFTGSLKLSPILERGWHEEKHQSLNIPMTAQNNVQQDINTKHRVLIDLKVDNALPLACNLMLIHTQQRFTEQTMETEDLLKIFCRSTLADQRKSHRCFSNISKLRNHDGKDHFHCHVVHIPEQLLSGVQVFFKDRLMASSYVIGSSQLPKPSQVSQGDSSMAFEPESGDRAMLIRNSKGDWGLCIGRWMTDVEDDFLKIKFMILSKTKLEVLEVHTVDVHFQSFYANLQTGAISIDPTNNTVCENIALIFSLSILHALCSPKQLDRRIKSTLVSTQENSPAETPNVTAEVPTLIPEANCALLLAAGLQTYTPNNQYILQKYGSLSVDLKFDAQDIFLDEVKIDKSLFQSESKLSEWDIQDETPRKITSKIKLDTNLQVSNTFSSDNNKSNDTDKQSGTKETKANKRKRKRIRKRKSTKLEDALCPSDDSLDMDVKEEMQFLQKKGTEADAVVESVATEKLMKKKKSSTLADGEELSPSEDSLDEAEKEWKEFKGVVESEINESDEQNLAIKTNTANQTSDPEQNKNTSSSNEVNLAFSTIDIIQKHAN